MSDAPGRVSPDDLLVLLSVARLGRFTAVAEALSITHTTVSRRIAALERQLGGHTLERTPHGWELTELGRTAVAAAEGIQAQLSTLSAALLRNDDVIGGLVRVGTSDAFGALLVTPALTRLRRDHPQLRIEVLSATRPVSQNRSGVDVEMLPGLVAAPTRAKAVALSEYSLRLYVGAGYAAEHGVPTSVEELMGHPMVSYVETAMQLEDLNISSLVRPAEPAGFQATSIFAQAEAVRAGAGVGLLPPFMVHRDPDFVPVLHHLLERRMPFGAAVRPESLRSPAVQAVLAAVEDELHRRRDELLPPRPAATF